MSFETLDEEQTFAPGLILEPGDKVIGTVTELSERDAGYGLYPIVTLQIESFTNALGNPKSLPGDDGRGALHASASVLQSKLAGLHPEIGDRIGVKYFGKVDGKKGGPQYHNYNVQKDGTAPAATGVDWAARKAEVATDKSVVAASTAAPVDDELF